MAAQSVTTVSSRAFYKCNQLTYVSVPSDADVASNAFTGCTASIIYY